MLHSKVVKYYKESQSVCLFFLILDQNVHFGNEIQKVMMLPIFCSLLCYKVFCQSVLKHLNTIHLLSHWWNTICGVYRVMVFRVSQLHPKQYTKSESANFIHFHFGSLLSFIIYYHFYVLTLNSLKVLKISVSSEFLLSPYSE